MARNGKAGYRLAHGSGSNEKWLTGNQRRFFHSDYKDFVTAVQCKFCASEDLRFAIDGYCLRCQQRAEYVIREHPATAARVRGADQ